MANLLFLKNYNNYFNRRIKTDTNFSNYNYEILQNTNFNPNDEVITEHIINWSNTWTPDYMIVLKNTTIVEGEPLEVDQRWFVIDTKRTRKGQYKLTLKRDVIADNYTGLSTGIFSIDRCKLEDTNPLIYNKEPFQYNQIKQDEAFLYDDTNCPWIVGYMDKDAAVDRSEDGIILSEDYDVDLSTTDYDDWIYHNIIGVTSRGNFNIVNTDVIISYERDWWVGGYQGAHAYQNKNRAYSETISGEVGTSNETIRYSQSNYNSVKDNTNRYQWINWTTAQSRLMENVTETNIISQSDINTLLNYDGKKIKFADGIYLIHFRSIGSGETSREKVNDTLTQYIVQCFQDHVSGSVKNSGKSTYSYSFSEYLLTTQDVTASTTGEINYKFTAGTRNLIDAPYRMFCMPYPNATSSADSIIVNGWRIDRETIFRVTQDIIIKGEAHIYDVQLLPYCPITFSSYTRVEGTRSTYLTMKPEFQVDLDYVRINRTVNGSTGIAGYIFFPTESSFTRNITQVFVNNESTKTTISNKYNITNKKIQNETEFVRFCSPNYASVFEFSPAKNNGIPFVNVMCTYKPFNPFILVAPEFENLYGDSFKDSRGLVLAGDFSLARVTDSWINYELNNKTYQQSFNREITSMEREYSIQREEAGWQIAAGTLTGAASGAVAGGMAGGGYGAAAGAIVGGASSLIGGILDYQNLGRRQDEALNSRKDLFRYQLQNIKALPDTLNKTTSINANSKYVPYIELYSSTEQEKEYLANFIEYNGMAAGYVDSITPDGYVQATIIKYNEPLAAQEVDEINKELMKGVYFE